MVQFLFKEDISKEPTPLLRAAREEGHGAVVQLLLAKGNKYKCKKDANRLDALCI